MYVFIRAENFMKLHGTSLAWRIHFSRRAANLSLGSLGSEKLPWTRWASLARRLTFEASQMPKGHFDRSLMIFDDIFYNILWQHFQERNMTKRMIQTTINIIYKTNIWNHWISLKSLSWSMMVFFFFSPFSFKKSAWRVANRSSSWESFTSRLVRMTGF